MKNEISSIDDLELKIYKEIDILIKNHSKHEY